MDITRVGTDNPTRLQKVTKTITFDGSAGSGAIGQVTVFTVTGINYVQRLIPYCTVDLVSATGTISLGRAAAVTALLGVTTAADLDANEYWLSTTPGSGFIALPAALKDSIYATDVTIDVLTLGISAGAIIFYIEYIPISAGAVIS